MEVVLFPTIEPETNGQILAPAFVMTKYLLSVLAIRTEFFWRIRRKTTHSGGRQWLVEWETAWVVLYGPHPRRNGEISYISNKYS